MLLNHYLCCCFQSCRQRISAQTNYILRANDKRLEYGLVIQLHLADVQSSIAFPIYILYSPGL